MKIGEMCSDTIYSTNILTRKIDYFEIPHSKKLKTHSQQMITYPKYLSKVKSTCILERILRYVNNYLNYNIHIKHHKATNSLSCHLIIFQRSEQNPLLKAHSQTTKLDRGKPETDPSTRLPGFIWQLKWPQTATKGIKTPPEIHSSLRGGESARVRSVKSVRGILEHGQCTQVRQ